MWPDTMSEGRATEDYSRSRMQLSRVQALKREGELRKAGFEGSRKTKENEHKIQSL